MEPLGAGQGWCGRDSRDKRRVCASLIAFQGSSANTQHKWLPRVQVITPPARPARAWRVGQMDIPDKTGTGDIATDPTVERKEVLSANLSAPPALTKSLLLPLQDPVT